MSETTMLPDGWEGVYVLHSWYFDGSGNGTPLRVYRDKDKAEADRKLLTMDNTCMCYAVTPIPLVP